MQGNRRVALNEPNNIMANQELNDYIEKMEQEGYEIYIRLNEHTYDVELRIVYGEIIFNDIIKLYGKTGDEMPLAEMILERLKYFAYERRGK